MCFTYIILNFFLIHLPLLGILFAIEPIDHSSWLKVLLCFATFAEIFFLAVQALSRVDLLFYSWSMPSKVLTADYDALQRIWNKKPTNWWAKHCAIIFYNRGRHTVKFIVSLLVILHQSMTKLCACMPTTSILRTFVQYLIAFCSRPEAANDVIAGRFVRLAAPKNFATLS